jgi:anti-repressor protein
MLRNVAVSEKCKKFCTLVGTGAPSAVGVFNGANRWFVTENGFYEVLMQSKMPKAKAFKDAVKKILHQIRTTGGYIPVKKGDSDADILSRAVLIAKATIDRQGEEIVSLNKELAEARPLAEYAKAVTDSDGTMLIRTFSKIARQSGIVIGEKRMYQWLRDNGFLLRTGDSQNTPSQKAMEMRLFRLKEMVRKYADGTTKTMLTPKLTGRGRVYFLERLRKDMNIDRVPEKIMTNSTTEK